MPGLIFSKLLTSSMVGSFLAFYNKFTANDA